MRNFCGLAVTDHSEPQTNNFLLIICLGKLLSWPHSSPAELNALGTASEAHCCWKGNRELLNSAQKSENTLFGRSEDFSKEKYPYPTFSFRLCSLCPFILSCETGILASARPTNQSRGPRTAVYLHSANTANISLGSLSPAVILRMSKRLLLAEEDGFCLKLLLKCESKAHDIIFNLAWWFLWIRNWIQKIIFTLNKYDFTGHATFRPPLKIHIRLEWMCYLLPNHCKPEGKAGEKGK